MIANVRQLSTETQKLSCIFLIHECCYSKLLLINIVDFLNSFKLGRYSDFMKINTRLQLYLSTSVHRKYLR